MTRSRILAAGAATLALALPATAAAKGGGGGGNTPAPAPAPSAAVECDYSLDGVQADGRTVYSATIPEAGCFRFEHGGTFLRIYSIQPSPGWSYDVIYNGVGPMSTMKVRFTKGKQKVDVMYEFGKTVIDAR